MNAQDEHQQSTHQIYTQRQKNSLTYYHESERAKHEPN